MKKGKRAFQDHCGTERISNTELNTVRTKQWANGKCMACTAKSFLQLEEAGTTAKP